MSARPISTAEMEEMLLGAVKFAAEVVVNYGDAYAPTFDRLERELVALRQSRSPAERARLAIDTYTARGGLKAIR